MSFGSSAGDFVLLVHLAHRAFRNLQAAGEDYVDISGEVRSLHSVLRTLRSESQKLETKLFAQDATSAEQLMVVANSCKNTLDNLDNILVKYKGLKTDGQLRLSKNLWQKLRSGSKLEELGAIRGSLITNTSIISILIDTMQVQDSDRMGGKIGGALADTTQQVVGQFEQMRKEIFTIAARARAEERRRAITSPLSLCKYTGEDEKVWQEFQKALLRRGFPSTSLERHRSVLQAYMVRLGQSGLLDRWNRLRRHNKGQVKTLEPYERVVTSSAKVETVINLPAKQVDSLSKPALLPFHDQHCESENDPPKGLLHKIVSPSEVTDLATAVWDRESTSSSDQNNPSEDGASISVSSSETESAGACIPHEDMLKAKSIDIPPAVVLSQRTAPEPSMIDRVHLVLTKNIVSDWLGKEDLQKAKPQAHAYVRGGKDEDKMNASDPKQDIMSYLNAVASPPLEIPSTVTLNSPAYPHEKGSPTRLTDRIKSVSNSASNGTKLVYSDSHELTSVGRYTMLKSSWNIPTNDSMFIDDAISIDGSNKRAGRRDGERRRISSRPPSTSSQWQEVETNSKARRHSSYLTLPRPRSMPISPIGALPPQVHQSREIMHSYRRHSRSASTPTSPIRPTKPSLHQSKVHYRPMPILIVDPPLPQRLNSSPSPQPRLLKSILKLPTKSFPEDPIPERQGVAAHKDAKMGGVPVDARWTKISRKLVNPEALSAGKERFEVTAEHVIVLRVLSREDIEGYAEITKRIRGLREVQKLNAGKMGSESAGSTSTSN